MINFKQQELIEELFGAVKEKYPEVEFINSTDLLLDYGYQFLVMPRPVDNSVNQYVKP